MALLAERPRRQRRWLSAIAISLMPVLLLVVALLLAHFARPVWSDVVGWRDGAMPRVAVVVVIDAE